MIKTTCVQAFLIGLLSFISCGGDSIATTGNKSEAASNNGSPVFQRSTRSAPEIGQQSDNWCYSRYGASQVVNAETINTNRRYFFLTQPVTKLIAGPAGTTATFLLQLLPNAGVEIFTGVNFPECLSDPANLSTVGNGARLRYNNHKNIDFYLELQSENGLLRITLEFPPGANYAMSVNPCLECK